MDTWSGDEHSGLYNEEIYENVTKVHDQHFSAFSRLIRSTFDDAASYFSPGSIDLLHIDGLHTYEASKHDFETWRPLLASNAVVIFHDTSVRERKFGVWRLFDELRKEYPHFEFLHGQGLGIVGIGTEFPVGIANLFAATKDDNATNFIRGLFARLGLDVVSRLRLQNAENQTEAFNLQYEKLQTQLDKNEAHVIEIDAEINVLRHKNFIINRELDNRETIENENQHQISLILGSTTWRITKPLRHFLERNPFLSRMGRRALKLGWWTLKGQLPQQLRYWVIARRKRSSVAGVKSRIKMLFSLPSDRPINLKVPTPFDAYTCWLFVNSWNSRQQRRIHERLADTVAPLPSFSILMPVYRPNLDYLRRAIESVQRQVYEQWEFCIADDASGSAELSTALRNYATKDARIKIVFRETNGHISHATNSAADLASSDFFVLLDQDDELAPDALAELALHIAVAPDTDFIYSDSDKIDAHGRRNDPHFKPVFSPELLLGYMYAGQTLCIRATLWRELGGLRPGYEGSQDHDLALRACERARTVGHVPKVLYHWRSIPGSTAMSGTSKPYSFEAGRKAVQDALDRRGSTGTAYRPDWAVRNGNSLFHVEFPDDGPSVGILIPTRNQLSLIKSCMKALSLTSYKHFRVLIVDNDSDDPATLEWLKRLPSRTDIKVEVLRVSNAKHGKFNFSQLVNEGVAHLQTDYVLLLNNDVEVINPKWLSSLVGYAQMPKVGCVGGLLRYPDRTVQHAGITQTDQPPTLVDHTFKHALPHDAGYLSYIHIARNTVGVTAACMLVSREIFLSLDGLDENMFGVAYNDVDFCFRVENAGYRNVYTPDAELIHHEGASRGFRDDPSELANFRARYAQRGDKYHNPNLSWRNLCLEVQPTLVVLGSARAQRVFVVTHNLNLEGAPKAILETCRCLNDSGLFTIKVFSPLEGPLRAEYEAAGIEVVTGPTPLSHGTELEEYELGLVAMAKLFQEFGADVVLGNTLQAFYAIDAAHAVGIPSLWVIHESEGWRGYFNFVSPDIERRAIASFGHPYRVVFVANATREIYTELDYNRNAIVIPGGLDKTTLQPFLSLSVRSQSRLNLGLIDADCMILLLGTVCDRKGQIDLVSALQYIKATRHEDTPHIFIVGDRESLYSRSLHAAITLLPEIWQGKVHVVKETSDVWPYYAAADLFVFTSRMESYPRVILEAMAFGLPIITTAVHGIVEQVRPGINAEFYVPGDTKALGRLVGEFLNDPLRRANYGANSIKVLRSLNTHETTAKMFGEVILEAAGASIAPSRLKEI